MVVVIIFSDIHLIKTDRDTLRIVVVFQSILLLCFVCSVSNLVSELQVSALRKLIAIIGLRGEHVIGREDSESTVNRATAKEIADK